MANIWQQIRDEVGLRLQNITEANGYSTTLICIERGRVDPLDDRDLPGINFWKLDDVADDKRYTRQQRTLRIGFEMYDTTRDDDVDTISDGFMSDIFIALYREPANPRVDDEPRPFFPNKQLVVSIDVLRPLISQGSSPRVGVFGIISFTYSVNNLDPNTLL